MRSYPKLAAKLAVPNAMDPAMMIYTLSFFLGDDDGIENSAFGSPLLLSLSLLSSALT